MSRCRKVKMYRECCCTRAQVSRYAYYAPGRYARASVFVVQAGEPGREPVDRGLELGCGVHELPQPFGEPAQADLLVAAALREFLDAPVGEVHDLARGQRRLDHLGVLGGVRDG